MSSGKLQRGSGTGMIAPRRVLAGGGSRRYRSVSRNTIAEHPPTAATLTARVGQYGIAMELLVVGEVDAVDAAITGEEQVWMDTFF